MVFKRASSNRELDLLRDLAFRLARTGRFEDARRAAEGIVALFPEDARGHALLGALWERCGDRQAARCAYERAVERNPTDAASLLQVGRMRILAGDREGGLELVRRAWMLARRYNDDVARLARVLLESYGG